jgi:hypothetical protein
MSIGGIAATHLGRSGLVDFLMIDRSFSDLLVIPRQSGRALPLLLQALTLWQNPECSKDFLFSNCYKVLSCDPHDEVVADPCSLKTGLAMEILKNELELMQYEKALSNTSLGYQKAINISQYFHILN